MSGKKILDKLTEKAVSSGTLGQFKGCVGAMLGVLVLSITYVVPEDYEHYVQYGCLFVIAIGLLKIVFETLK